MDFTQQDIEELLSQCAVALLEDEEFVGTCGGGAVTSGEGLLECPESREFALVTVLAAQHLPHTTVQIIVDGKFIGQEDVWMGLGFSVADDGTGDMTDELRKAARNAATVIVADLFEKSQ